MAKTPEQMAQSMINNMPEKTGKALPAWLDIVRGSGLAKHGEIVRLLKTDHGMTHGFANLVAHQFINGPAPADGNELVDKQYSGPKADLRPIYEAIVALASSLGSDVEVSPKKSYVSLRRNKQFALVQPSTRTRVDLGINLKGEEPVARLEASGSFNAMVSHRVRLEKAEDVDDEINNWLKRAYERA